MVINGWINANDITTSVRVILVIKWFNGRRSRNTAEKEKVGQGRKEGLYPDLGQRAWLRLITETILGLKERIQEVAKSKIMGCRGGGGGWWSVGSLTDYTLSET